MQLFFHPPATSCGVDDVAKGHNANNMTYRLNCDCLKVTGNEKLKATENRGKGIYLKIKEGNRSLIDKERHDCTFPKTFRVKKIKKDGMGMSCGTQGRA